MVASSLFLFLLFLEMRVWQREVYTLMPLGWRQAKKQEEMRKTGLMDIKG